MNPRTVSVYLVLVGMLVDVLSSSTAIGDTVLIQAGEESIVIDTQTDNNIITYRGDDGTIKRAIWEPTNKIDPSIKSKFKVTKDETFVYRYKIKNGVKSKQALQGFHLKTSYANGRKQTTPQGWIGSVNRWPDQTSYEVDWSILCGRQRNACLAPGTSQNGFMLESPDLPGMGLARSRGAATIMLAYPDEGPNENKIQAYLGENRPEDMDSVPRPATVPLIPVPNPFDAAAVLASMQQHVNQDLVAMKLIDPVFASQLDRLFQAAITAAKGGNTVALKGNLKDLRHLLKSEHADVDKDDENWDKDDDDKDKEKDKSRLVDKLAAKVLDFDLRYVEKRLKAGKDD
jgi:hypothetical protein